MIPQSFIQELLSRIDIVELIGRVTPLKKTGKNYMCCCPFHKEKTPSFSVSAQKQFYKCFGCGASGSAIGFVMQYEGLTYPEAIAKLAESVGLTVPQDPKGRERSAKVRTLTDLMQEASRFYSTALKGNQRASDYLKERGIQAATAERFALGYSPEGWHALKEVFGTHYDSAQLEESQGCGLVIRNDEGRRYDRFRGRLMFPIRNKRGQVIGFGARTLNGDEHPKYLNSPETAIYRKGQEIYGLYEAQQAMRSSDRAIVCEGYMDVIQLSQAGFIESCAALGTAVTADHVRKLLKIVDHVYFSFDGDTAGQNALRRAMEAALPAVGDAQEVRFVVLPPEHDPDSLIKERGKDAFEAELAKSLTLTQFFIKTLSQGKDLSTPEGRSQLMSEAKPLVVSMQKAPLLRTQLVAELAMHVRMGPDALERTFGIVRAQPTGVSILRQGKSRRFGREKTPARIAPAKNANRDERLLQNLLSYPILVQEFASRIEEEFVGSQEKLAQEIVEVWRAVFSGDEPLEHTQLVMQALSESDNFAHYSQLLGRELELQTSLEAARAETEMLFDRKELLRVEELSNEEARNPQFDAQKLQQLFARIKTLRSRIASEEKRHINAASAEN